MQVIIKYLLIHFLCSSLSLIFTSSLPKSSAAANDFELEMPWSSGPWLHLHPFSWPCSGGLSHLRCLCLTKPGLRGLREGGSRGSVGFCRNTQWLVHSPKGGPWRPSQEQQQREERPAFKAYRSLALGVRALPALFGAETTRLVFGPCRHLWICFTFLLQSRAPKGGTL